MMNGYLEEPHIKNALKSTEQGAASIVLAAVGKDYEGVGGFLYGGLCEEFAVAQ